MLTGRPVVAMRMDARARLLTAGLAVLVHGVAVRADTVPLPVAADTYIQAGREATRVHGASTNLRIDGVPATVTYLKFDLSAVPQRVTKAVLALHVTDASSDGG